MQSPRERTTSSTGWVTSSTPRGSSGDGKVELTLLQNLVRGTPPRQGTPIFQLVKTGTSTCEVSFTLSAVAAAR